MERFFFDTHDGVDTIRDEEGVQLPDRAAARRQAIGALPDIAHDVRPGGGDRRDTIVDVRGAARQVVFTAILSLVARGVG